jgi:EAL domain-containing protein (putative c-di-GMP-specific phosphodiesterase class I)
MPDGAIYKLLVEHQPQFSDKGKVTGFFMLISDITSPGDVHMPAASKPAVQPMPESIANQNTFVDSFSEEIMGQTDATHIKAAIEKGEFRLFCQLISPLAAHSAEAEHFEILVRLLEEEEGMMPPGAFFPLAEKYGLMPHLDRWVVQHVTEWATHRNAQDEKRKSSMFFINVSGATMADPTFPDYGVPGALLCFEISSTELAINPPAVADFAQRVRLCGCRIALSGFGKERIAFDQIRGFQVDFLKIDGSIVFDVLRSPVALAKVTAINRVAKAIGMKTVAELVENEETISRLREIGVDYAQGFGISRPQPLAG